MPRNRCGFAALVLFLLTAPAHADSLDVLQGKFAFNWFSEPKREKCIKVAGRLMADFKSSRYRCDVKAKTNSESGAAYRRCTAVNKRKEYLIYDTLRACEYERKVQASNE